MNYELRKALCKALLKNNVDNNLICIVSSIGDTVTELEALELLDAYNSNDGLWEEVLASVPDEDANANA